MLTEVCGLRPARLSLGKQIILCGKQMISMVTDCPVCFSLFHSMPVTWSLLSTPADAATQPLCPRWVLLEVLLTTILDPSQQTVSKSAGGAKESASLSPD